MCLSTVYRNEQKPENIAMTNVKRIDCTQDTVILTDLLERQMAISGVLLRADLVEGTVVVRELSE